MTNAFDPFARMRSINEVSGVSPSDFGPAYATAPPVLPCSSPIQNVPVEVAAALRELKMCPNRVNIRFFSHQNVDLIQRQMQAVVRRRTKQNIDKQDEIALRVMMRGVYLEYSTNTDFDVAGQVADLNHKVLSVVVPQVLNGIAMRATYLKDMAHLPRPLERGKNTSVVGSRSYG
jgi:hypothetical protein